LRVVTYATQSISDFITAAFVGAAGSGVGVINLLTSFVHESTGLITATHFLTCVVFLQFSCFVKQFVHFIIVSS